MVLFLLNLLPIPPLDGASAMRLVLPEDLALRLQLVLQSRGFAILVLLFIFFGFGRIVSPLWRGLVELLHPGVYS